MKKFAIATLLLAFAATCSNAQQWEFGGVAGGAFLNTVNVSGSGVGSAKAGFEKSPVFGAFVGQNISSHIAGEIRYEYMPSNLELSSGGATAHFNGQSHALHYDLLLHTSTREAPVEFFVAVGGGMKVFRATGTEAAYQPLSQFGYFTKTQTIKPMASVGGGMAFRISKHVRLRAEVRDFITAFPTQVLTPPPGVKYPTLLHDLVPMAGLSYLF